jgi:hypothetical protein
MCEKMPVSGVGRNVAIGPFHKLGVTFIQEFFYNGIEKNTVLTCSFL